MIQILDPILDPFFGALVPAVFKDVVPCFLVPVPPESPEGGSGLSFSFRSQGVGPDPGSTLNLNFDFDLKHSWVVTF